jgi:WD40 repeat protein
VSWSADGQLLLTRNDNMPNCLWVWAVADLGLRCLLVQKDPVRSARWSPANELTVATGSPRFYVWSPSEGPTWHDIPLQAGSFDVLRIRCVGWVALGRRTFCIQDLQWLFEQAVVPVIDPLLSTGTARTAKCWPSSAQITSASVPSHTRKAAITICRPLCFAVSFPCAPLVFLRCARPARSKSKAPNSRYDAYPCVILP